MKKLGKVQTEVLRCLRQHGQWKPNCVNSWSWGSQSNTLRLMDSLVRAGVAEKVGAVYVPVRSGT